MKFYDDDQAKNDVAAQVVERILRWRATSSSSMGAEDAQFEAENLEGDAVNRGANMLWRLSKQFITDLFMNPGSARGSVGNTGPQTAGGWGTAEGLATDGKTAEFCDAIADWWPDVSFFSFLFIFYYFHFFPFLFS